MHLQENRSISDAQVFTAECWNAKVTCGWNVSEDLFFKVKKQEFVSFSFYSCFIEFSSFLFYFVFDCVSVTFAFCIPNIVYCICHWSNMYLSIINQKTNRKSYNLLCAILCRNLFIFHAVFPRSGTNRSSKSVAVNYWRRQLN